MSDHGELTLEPTGGKRKRPRQTAQDKLASQTPTVRLEGLFQIAYEQAWGFPVILNPARDRAILKDLVEQLGAELVESLIPDFFHAVRPVSQGGDPVVSRSRYSNIMDFRFHAQRLLMLRRNGAGLAGRTADNVHEVMKATGRAQR